MAHRQITHKSGRPPGEENPVLFPFIFHLFFFFFSFLFSHLFLFTERNGQVQMVGGFPFVRLAIKVLIKQFNKFSPDSYRVGSDERNDITRTTRENCQTTNKNIWKKIYIYRIKRRKLRKNGCYKGWRESGICCE